MMESVISKIFSTKTIFMVLSTTLFVLLGFILVAKPQFIFTAFSIIILAFMIKLFLKLVMSTNNKHLIILIIIALVVRITLAVFLHFTNVLEESDAIVYHNQAVQFSSALLGKQPIGYIQPKAYGYVYFLSILYAGFGAYSLIPKIINCFAGVASCIYIYKFAMKFWDNKKMALVSFSFALFLPGILVWSATNIRDIWVALLVFISLWHMWSLREKGINVKDIFITTICLSIIWTLRFYITLLLIPLVIFILGAGRRKSIVYLSIIFLIVIFISGSLFINKDIGGVKISLEEMNERRLALVRSGGSAIEDTRSISNSLDALKFLPAGLIYFLFYPLPWSKPTSQIYALSLLEMMFYYLLIPFITIGIYRAVKRKVIGAGVLFFYLISSALLYAIMAGNIGTLYRMRMPVSMILMIFVSGGFYSLKNTLNCG